MMRVLILKKLELVDILKCDQGTVEVGTTWSVFGLIGKSSKLNKSLTMVCSDFRIISRSDLFFANTDVEITASKLGFAFDDNFKIFTNECENFIKHDLAEIFVRQFASAENNHDFYAIAIS